MSKRAEKAIEAYYGNIPDDADKVKAARHFYEQAEKDIEALILKFLDSRNDRDYATVGWIKKNFGEYKKEIMEEE